MVLLFYQNVYLGLLEDILLQQIKNLTKANTEDSKEERYREIPNDEAWAPEFSHTWRLLWTFLLQQPINYYWRQFESHFLFLELPAYGQK